MNKPRRKNGESIDEYLRRACNILYSNGYHYSEIAKKLKVNKIVVYNILVKRPTNRVTTTDERNAMIKLRGQGYSYRTIANIMGRSATCVHERIKREAHLYEDYKENNLKDKDIERLKQWYIEGKTLKFIADKLEISTKSVVYRLKISGIYDPHRSPSRVSSGEEAGYRRMRKAGKTNGEIARAYGRNPSTVSRHLNK